MSMQLLYLHKFILESFCSRLYTYKVQDIMHRLKYISYLFYQFQFQNIYFLQAHPIDLSLAKRSGARKVTPAIDISIQVTPSIYILLTHFPTLIMRMAAARLQDSPIIDCGVVYLCFNLNLCG